MSSFVSGSAAYRERMALPPGAVFEAVLEDVSKADGPAEVMGTVRREEPGTPPYDFQIEYDPARIEPSHTYSVRARILVEGKLFFTSDQHHPVLTRDAPNHVDIGMRRVGAQPAPAPPAPLGPKPAPTPGQPVAPIQPAPTPGQPAPLGPEPVPTPAPPAPLGPEPAPGQPVPVTPMVPSAASLTGTYWKLVWLPDTPVVVVPQQREGHIVLEAGTGKLHGAGGCNRLAGSYTLDGSSINLGKVAATMMACVDGMEMESAFTRALGTVSRWRINGQQLELSDDSGRVVARFEAVYLH